MRIVYAPLIDKTGTFNDAEMTLSGAVQLNVTVNGRIATITLTPKEAAQLSRQLRDLDVEAMAALDG